MNPDDEGPRPEPSESAEKPGARAPVSEPRRPRRRGIYLLPNLFTTAALFAGFYAIVAAMGGRFDAAAAAIIVAMVLDGVDGRIARLTNTQSEFGAEYDSLSDVISFGLAPALLTFTWALSALGKIGWLAAFIYSACTALRLARFNTQIGTADKRYFQGLPCPAAAAVLATWVWVCQEYGAAGGGPPGMTLALVLFCAVLMVSNIRFYSFKEFDLKGRVSFVTVVAIVLVFVLVFSDPPLVLFVVFLGYAVSGPLLTLWLIRRRRAERRAERGGGSAP